MLSLNFDPFPLISTERLQLRRVTVADAAEIFFLRSDPQVLQFLDRAPAASLDDARQWITNVDEQLRKNDVIFWGLALHDEPGLIGQITFWNIQKEHYRAEIGYAIHPSCQGRGLMNEAMKAVLDFGFRTMKLHSVEANVNPANVRSIRLLEGNNFIREGYYKENYYFNGKFLDSAIYSLLAPY